MKFHIAILCLSINYTLSIRQPNGTIESLRAAVENPSRSRDILTSLRYRPVTGKIILFTQL